MIQGQHEPGLGGIRSFIIYSEIFNQSPTPRYVELLFERMNQAQVMRLISSVSLLLFNDPLNALSSEQQRQLTRPYEREQPWIRRLGQLISNNRVLVHDIQIGIMARLGILHSLDTDTNGNFIDLFFRALLAVNELHGKTQLRPGPKQVTPDAFLQIELQSEILPNERLGNVLRRYNRFIEWCRERGESDQDYLPIDTDFPRLIGMPFDDYAAASYSFFSKFLTLKSAFEIEDAGGPFLSLKVLVGSLSDPSALKTWLNRFSMTLDAMKEKLEADRTTYRSADLVPFIQTPLLLAEKDVIICPLPSLLQNTAGAGLYFSLFDAYKQEGGDDAAMRFSRAFGLFLEDYCYELLSFGTAKLPITVSREIKYDTPQGQRKSTDIVLRDEYSVAAFLEISKKRFNLLKTIVDEDATGLATDIDQMVIEKAQQIDRSYRDLLTGYYTYPFEIALIVPIVVTAQDIPGMLAVKKIIRDRIRERGFFAGLPATELAYLSIDELESLVVAYPGTLDLGALVREKLDHPSSIARAAGVRNYLYFFKNEDVTRDGARGAVLPGDAEYFRNVIMKTLERWGLQVDWEQTDRFLAERHQAAPTGLTRPSS